MWKEQQMYIKKEQNNRGRFMNRAYEAEELRRRKKASIVT